MDSVSIFSYYFNLIVSYVNYFVAYYSDKFRDYPFEVKTAIWVIQWIIICIIILTLLIEKQESLNRKRKRVIARLKERYDEAVNYIFSIDDEHTMTRDEIISRFHIDEKEQQKRGLLATDHERRQMCRLIYNRLIRDDIASPSRTRNLHLLLDIFNLPSFLESEVSLGRMKHKMKAMTMIRAFKLYISPWVINKLLNSKQTQVRRLALYLSVMSSSDSELEYFETDFFDKNSCIYDEIELGYTLHRRRVAGLKLPNLAHWAHIQKNDSAKCMFVRLMRRFDQREYCNQLTDIFMESKHKKLIEEISRTWGYLHYTDGEQLLVNTMLTQPDDTKVAIMHAVTRLASGKNLELLLDGYHTSNPHVRFEALRCMYSYGEEGRNLLKELEEQATPSDKKFFSFFHNPITLARIPLDKEQAYHPSVETVYNFSE